MSDDEQPGSGSGPGSASGSGPGSASGAGPGSASGAGAGSRTVVAGTLFDHEKLEVYRVAREFFVLATALTKRKLPNDFRVQFDSAAVSILSNIGEGAGKTSKPDKRRYYEIARGSTTEAATQLDVLRIRGLVTEGEYATARTLLLRVAQMLSRLVSSPRFT